MAYAVLIIVVLLIIAVIVHAVTGESRYAKMTEKEFEEDAQRGSALGGALLEIQQIVQGKKVEYMMQQDKRVEGDSAEAGDKPTGSDS